MPCLLADQGGVRRGGDLGNGGDLQEAPAEDPLPTIHLQHVRLRSGTDGSAASPAQAEGEEHRIPVSLHFSLQQHP